MLLLGSYAGNAFYKWLVYLSGALLLSFARPEFYLSFIMIGGLGLLYFLVKSDQVKRKFMAPLGIFAVFAAMLHVGLGNPLLVKLEGHNRSVIAFGEHFAYNYAKWNDSPTYDWLRWEEIVEEEFGEINSVKQANRKETVAS